MAMVDYNRLDDALEILAPYDSISNHGPMAAEALCALGRGYVRHLMMPSEPGDRFGFCQKPYKQVQLTPEIMKKLALISLRYDFPLVNLEIQTPYF